MKKSKKYQIDEQGQKYIEVTTTPSGEDPKTDRITKYDTEWALSSLASIKICSGWASKVLYELEGLSKEELRTALINDREHGGNKYDDIIQLGKLLEGLE